jgi:hypothetical protein
MLLLGGVLDLVEVGGLDERGEEVRIADGRHELRLNYHHSGQNERDQPFSFYKRYSTDRSSFLVPGYVPEKMSTNSPYQPLSSHLLRP